jgi:hypothetical protein
MAILCSTGVFAAGKIVFAKTATKVRDMDHLRFLSLSGRDRVLDYTLLTAEYGGEVYSLFSLEDPFTYSLPRKQEPFPEYVDRDLVEGIVTLFALYDAKEASVLADTPLSSSEYIAATQVALYRAVGTSSQQYRLDADSVKNSNVVAAANWLLKLAEVEAGRKPSGGDMLSTIIPDPAIRVNSSSAKGNVEGNFNFYGPYFIESSDLSLVVYPQGGTEQFALVNAVGGTVVESVTVNAPFYVRFDKGLISDLTIGFSAQARMVELVEYSNFIFAPGRVVDISTQMTISNQNAAGRVLYVKSDSLTQAAVPGVVVEIRDLTNKLITTMTTQENGEATSPELRVGSYMLVEVATAQGYSIDSTLHDAVIRGNGEVVRVTSQAVPIDAVVTFLCIDSSTNAPVGGSVFAIVDSSGNSVVKIGFKANGRCANIRLPSGSYQLQEQSTGAGYELLVEDVTFKAEAGVYQEVLIRKHQAFSYTTFVVVDASRTPLVNVALDLFTSEGRFLASLVTSSDGRASVSLPVGRYYVVQKASGSIPGGDTQAFQVTALGVETFVTLGASSYESSISGVVADSSGNGLPGVGLVAVGDTGEEYSLTDTNYDGSYELSGVPDRSVVYIKVYRAPFGFSGELTGARVVMSSKRSTRDLILLTLDEVNASLPEDGKIVRYDFYHPSIDGAVSESQGGLFTVGAVSSTSTTRLRTSSNLVTRAPASATEVVSQEAESRDETTSPTGAIVLVIVVLGIAAAAVWLVRRRSAEHPVSNRERPADRPVIRLSAFARARERATALSEVEGSVDLGEEEEGDLDELAEAEDGDVIDAQPSEGGNALSNEDDDIQAGE